MKFNSKTEATGFLAESNISFEVKATLIDIIDEHALEGGSFEIVGDKNDVMCVIFEADHDVAIEKEVGSSFICAHSVKGACVTTIINQENTQEKTMDKNTQDIAAAVAAEMEKFKAEQRAKFDEAVKQAVEEQLAAKKAAAAPIQEEKGRLARLMGKVNVQAVKKVAMYTAGAAAVAGGGYFAWKKFCGGDSIIAAVVPVASEQL